MVRACATAVNEASVLACIACGYIGSLKSSIVGTSALDAGVCNLEGHYSGTENYSGLTASIVGKSWDKSQVEPMAVLRPLPLHHSSPAVRGGALAPAGCAGRLRVPPYRNGVS